MHIILSFSSDKSRTNSDTKPSFLHTQGYLIVLTGFEAGDRVGTHLEADLDIPELHGGSVLEAGLDPENRDGHERTKNFKKNKLFVNFGVVYKIKEHKMYDLDRSEKNKKYSYKKK